MQLNNSIDNMIFKKVDSFILKSIKIVDIFKKTIKSIKSVTEIVK